MVDEEAARVWGLNLRLSTEVLSEATPGIEALGVEAKEFFVLDGAEELSFPAEIAHRLSMSRPALTLHLRNLERKGMLTRAMDQHDLRRHRLTLTDLGREVTAKARRLLSHAYAARLERLSVDERQAFRKLLAKLVS